MKNNLSMYRFFAVVIAIGLLPVAGFSQEAADEPLVQDAPQVERASGASSNGSLSTSPWPGNNSSRSNTTTNQMLQRPGSNAALRPVAGNTVLAGEDPGGNPDVPFDDNMNLGFLAVAIVFAFMVIRKRLMNKAVTVSK